MKYTLFASLARVALLAALATLQAFPSYAADTPAWQAVTSEVPVAKKVEIEVRLVGISPPPALEDITVISSRIDMGPDGMAAMTAPLRPLRAKASGVLAFETELVMAGRWALTISAKIKGQDQPIANTVVITAVENKADATPAKSRRILYYRNPMGLPDVSPTPKKDSMGMDYIPVYDDETGGPKGTVRISPEKIQRAGVRTAPAIKQIVTRTIRAAGVIVPDEARTAVVTAKFNGFIEELFVPVTGAHVREGDRLIRVWIESPEILQKQADLTSILAGTRSSAGTPEAAERNLRFFGFSDEAIADIRRSGRPLRSITVTAPRDGTVLSKPAVVGMRFAAGDTLFRTADLSTVWVMGQVAERDLAHISIGQTARVTLPAFPGEVFEGQVAFVYPEINMATRTVPIRIVLSNLEGRLLAGLYVDVVIEARADTGAVVAIPDSAIIDSGTRRIAFVAKGNGLFEPRNLTVGLRGNGFVEVREGITEGEEVVVSGNFLIDAESNLKAALSAFTPPETAK